ncbi:MAG: hypothetical protein F7B20_00020 [Aeropyrum sp.]|nr:hypothetical protein [Aeropyrum sp.]
MGRGARSPKKSAKGPPKGPSASRYAGLEERLASVDEIAFPKLERALRKGSVSMLLGGQGDLKLIHVGKIYYEGRYGRTVKRTTIVLDIVFDKTTLEIKHLGLKGVRGWNPEEPDRVDLPREYDLVENTKKRKHIYK